MSNQLTIGAVSLFITYTYQNEIKNLIKNVCGYIFESFVCKIKLIATITHQVKN